MTTTTRNLRSDYLSGEASLQPFYQYAPQHPDFASIAADKSTDTIDRELLAAVIAEQYGDLDKGDAVTRNLQRLSQDNSYTITTGHQLVLFGGPLFTVYKILSVIKLAEKLSAEGKNVLPVFWIHTEDHDFEEINHYYQDFQTKRTYTGSFRTQVGAHVLEPSIESLRPTGFPAQLSGSYRPGIEMKQAFREFIHHLFGQYGLLILDADDPRLKAKFSGIITRELSDHFSNEWVSQTSAQMAEAGYSNQISPREINLFYLDAEGRNRIVAQKGGYQVLGRELFFEPAEMLRLAHEHPDRFSPNVSLRPLYQEMILPNLAYIGGWGELAYWLQLRGLFDEVGVNFRLLLPRISGTIFTESQAKSWKDLGFDLMAIRKPLHQLYDQYLPQVWDASAFEGYESKILALLDALEGYVKTDVSATLARSADALSTKTRHFLENLEKKAGKIKREQHREPFDQIRALKQQIEPDGLVQERTLSLASFAEWIPVDDFIAFLYREGDPLSLEHRCWVMATP